LTYAGLAQNIAEEEIQAKVIKAAKRLKIDNRIDDLAGDLSRGLRQRLAIAQAIIHEPEFLVLDEPASGLDPDARADLSNLFKQLRDEGMTLLVSSHILAELEDYATEMIIIRDGKLVGSKQSIENKNVITRRLVIRLSEEDDRLKEVLENNISVSSVSYEDGIATCVLSGGIEVQKNLLKELIKKDIPVSEYREGAVKLHDAYLRTIEQDLQETRQQGQ
jgi:ABC-2 type transport system ATP-binding protein